VNQKRTKNNPGPVQELSGIFYLLFDIPAHAIVGIFLVLTLVLLSILANRTGWSGGADKNLTAALGLVFVIPMGKFFTETSRKT